jgi:drug/metabolite transporter (DMT)-like permease
MFAPVRRHPNLLLSGAALLWADNVVLGRAMRGHIPPVGLAFWNAGVVQAGRAGVFLNLMPAFGTLLAVALLREPFHLFQTAGIGLIVAGVTLAQLAR